jgi:glycosyltransferase involved in cell wall biosynthesis
MAPGRVLYVATTARGGSAFSLSHLVRGLDTSRYEPVVLFYTQENPYIGDQLNEVDIQTITLKKWHQESVPVPTESVRHRDIGAWLKVHLGEWASHTYVFLKACFQFMVEQMPKIRSIVRVIRQHEIDLVHVNTGLRNGKAGIVAAWLAGIPCVCHVRRFEELEHFDKLFSRLVSSFVYISGAVAENYVAQGIPSNRGSVVYNVVDLADFSPDFDATSVRSEFGWTAQERLVGVIGRLDWWKGHEYFLEAVAQVVHQVPNLRGLIVGEPEDTPLNREYYQRLQSLARTLDLEDKIVFTGFRSDVPRILSALDVVVLSSSTPEPFGRVVIEGMAAGKPVVATAAGGVLEIIENGSNGLLVPCKNSQAMAQAILWFLSNQEKAAQIGSQARQFVAEKFAVERHVAQVQGIYDTTLSTVR